MGSPYFVHKQINRIHVIKTLVGLGRVLPIVVRSMGKRSLANHINLVDERSPEWVVLRDVLNAYRESFHTNSRAVIFLEARYEWTNWDKFQRVLVLDNCSGTFEALDDAVMRHYELFGPQHDTDIVWDNLPSE